MENEELKAKYNQLFNSVKVMMESNELWLKDKNNWQKKTTFFAAQSKVKEIINPKPKETSQARIDWLAQ